MSQEPLTIEGHWKFDYTYYAGAAASRFFAELRDGRLMGTVCPSCPRVLVPARGVCDACFVELTDWREVGLGGTLEAFTFLMLPVAGLPPPPIAVGYVKLEGASTAVLNLIEGVDLSDLDAAGARLLKRPRVRVRFKEKCEGRITDFGFVLEGAR